MEKELGTTYTFVGGNNKNRIGGSCSILEHKFSKGLPPARVMFDLGALFAPDYCLDVDAAIPDVREYLDSKDSVAQKRLDALFVSHGHEDHIGGLVHLARAGYTFPPIYASKGTLELLKAALNEACVDLTAEDWKNKLVEVKAGEPIKIMSKINQQFSGVEIEPFNVSHSTIGALGFHTLTTIDGKVEAGILHPGDFHLDKVRVGEGFDEEKFKELLNRKPVTHAILDSTSSGSSDEYLVTHEDAVNNTVEVVNRYPEKQVVSAVISRSVQNLAIDLDVAKKTGRKVFLDGYWLKIAYKAMEKSGVTEYNDDKVVFFGSAGKYKSEVPVSKRYIITSGAFAESKKGAKSGLYKMSEQEKVKTTKNKKSVKEISKADISGHPDFKVGDDTINLGRQRCIEEINGKQVRAMYARLAALGCTIIANENETPLGNFQTAKMQRSGHATRNETKKFVSMIVDSQKRPSDVTFIPTHGNPAQLINTAKAVKSAGGSFFFGNNLDVLQLSKDNTSKVDELMSDLWIGVCEESDNASTIAKYSYMLVDENFVQKAKLFDVKIEKPRRKNSWESFKDSQQDEKSAVYGKSYWKNNKKNSR